jgi:hypothetical protein
LPEAATAGSGTGAAFRGFPEAWGFWGCGLCCSAQYMPFADIIRHTAPCFFKSKGRMARFVAKGI